MWDYSAIEEASTTLAGVPFPLQYAVAIEQTVEEQRVILLTMQGYDAESGLWVLQISVPLERIVDGATLELDEDSYGFDATLLMGVFEGQSLTSLHLKGLAAGGQLTVDVASSCGTTRRVSASWRAEVL